MLPGIIVLIVVVARLKIEGVETMKLDYRGGEGGGRERGEIKSIFVKYIRKYKSLDVVCFERVEKEEEEEALSFSRTRYRIHR